MCREQECGTEIARFFVIARKVAPFVSLHVNSVPPDKAGGLLAVFEVRAEPCVCGRF